MDGLMELQFGAPLYIVSHKCTVPIIKEIKVQKNMYVHTCIRMHFRALNFNISF